MRLVLKQSLEARLLQKIIRSEYREYYDDKG